MCMMRVLEFMIKNRTNFSITLYFKRVMILVFERLSYAAHELLFKFYVY